jgi:hypothetical protein
MNWTNSWKRFEREVLPKLRESAVLLTIYSGAFDAKLALEFGAAYLLDKPILIVSIRGARIPTKMLAVVDEIVELEGDDLQTPGNFAKLRAGIERIMARR